MSLLSTSHRAWMFGFMFCVTLGSEFLTFQEIRYSPKARTAVLTWLACVVVITGALGIAVLRSVATVWLSPWRLVPTPSAAFSRSADGLPEVRSMRVSAYAFRPSRTLIRAPSCAGVSSGVRSLKGLHDGSLS